jgi:hypothetical protein
MVEQRRVISAVVILLRDLGRELAADGHRLAHRPGELAAALLEVDALGHCRCGNALPAPRPGAGRPRSRCFRCSPPRSRKSAANSTLGA